MNLISGYAFWANIHNKACKDKIPLSATFELTYNCNLRCEHCYITKDKAKKELEFREIIDLIDQLYKKGCITLAFTGGEIFTRKDCLEILSYASKKGFFISIISNATLINEDIINILKKVRLVNMSVSLYAFSQKVYKKVCGIDLFDKCLYGIGLIKDAGLPLKIGTLVTKDNISELNKIENFAKSINADFKSDPKITPSWDRNIKTIKKRVGNRDYINSCKYVFNRRPKKQDLKKDKQSIIADENTLKEISNNTKSKGRFLSCCVGKDSMIIDPYGYGYLCQSIPYPRFKITSDNGLYDMWKRLVEYRQRLVPDKDFMCDNCDLFDYCDWCPGSGLLEAGSLFKCVPYYKELALFTMKMSFPFCDIGFSCR